MRLAALLLILALPVSAQNLDGGSSAGAEMGSLAVQFPEGNGVEARVIELAGLGVTVCGEPLNGPETTTNGGVLEDGDDSDASNDTYECWGRGGSYDTFNTDGGVHAATAVTGWGSAEYALLQGDGYIWLRGLQPTAIGSGAKTLSYRYYKRIPATGYGSAGGQAGTTEGECAPGEFWRNKMADFFFDDGAGGQLGQVQLQEDPYFPGENGHCYSDGTFHPLTVGVLGQTQVKLSPEIDLSACVAAPCRIELRMEGDLTTGQDIDITAFVTPVSTGVTSSATVPTTDFPGGAISPWLWGGNLYRGDAPGYSLHNFFVQAIWDDVDDHTIGPAVEVEGTSDTTPPADPTSLGGSASSTQVSLSWSHPTPSDVAEYVVEYRCPSGSGSYVESTPRPTTTSKTVTGLTDDVECDFRVAAEDASDNRSGYAGPIQSTPTDIAFPVANGVEQRCVDLGSDCLCSEPLNADEGGGTFTSGHDFASSNNTYECGPDRASANRTIAVSNDNPTNMVPVTNHGSVEWALKGSPSFFLNGRSMATAYGQTTVLTGSEKQVCYRWYKQVSSDYGNTSDGGGACGSGQTWRNKIAQANFVNQAQTNQPEEINCSQPCTAGGNYCPIINGNDTEPPGGGWSGNVNLSPALTWENFKARPARIEWCIDSRASGGVLSGDAITFRLRIKDLTTGTYGRADTVETSGWGAPSLPDAWGIDGFHSGAGTDTYTMFIHTKSDTDPDVSLHWPGCAVEVEGTGCHDDD